MGEGKKRKKKTKRREQAAENPSVQLAASHMFHGSQPVCQIFIHSGAKYLFHF